MATNDRAHAVAPCPEDLEVIADIDDDEPEHLKPVCTVEDDEPDDLRPTHKVTD